VTDLHLSDAFLLFGGAVITADVGAPRAAAVGVVGNRIVAVGELDAVALALPPEAERIDVAGRTVVPGFIDAHNHYLATAESFAAIPLRDVTSIAELVARVDEVAERTEPGRWIKGMGIEWSALDEGRLPTRHDLDEVAREHPVLLEHVSGHAVLVNSRALAARGVADDAPDPAAGTLDRDTRGRLTGIVRDGATNLILGPSVDIGHHGPNFHVELAVEEGVHLLEAAAPRFAAAGITAIGDPQVTRRELGIYRAAVARGSVGPRIAAMPLSNQLPELESLGIVGPMGNDDLRITGLKLYTDGAITAGTAVFTDGLGPGRSPGTLYHEPAAFHELIRRAHTDGWQLAIHTMGDAAHEIMLDGVEAAMRADAREDPRHRIEHGTFPTTAQQRRIASLGMTPVTQPGSVRELGDVWVRQLGERVHRVMPLRSMLALGIRPAISSDAFVQSYRPLDTVSAAAHRVTPSGMRVGPEEELSIEEAIVSHTIDAARALRWDDRLGSLRPGKLADIAVIDGDVLATSPEAIGSLEMWLTIQDGRIVHDRRGHGQAPQTARS
jgi:predicted amidohydrolase YtcJ